MSSRAKILIGVFIGLLLIGGSTYFFTTYDFVKKEQNKSSQKSVTTPLLKKDFEDFFDDSFNDDFFDPGFSPFKQMEKMRENMEKLFNDQFDEKDSNSLFDNWFENKFGGSVFDIEQKEDDKYIYYEIKLEGLDRNQLKVNVSDGILEISGEVKEIEEKKSGTEILKSQLQQRFKRSFPVPAVVDADKVDFKTEGDKLIVKFPKKDDII